ncbi:MAG: hypothetical protein WCO35_00460 [Candidatus Nomurabacteria bacterium]
MTNYFIHSSILNLLIIFTSIQFILLILCFIFSFRKDEGKSAKIVYKISLVFLFIIIFFSFVVPSRCAPGECDNSQVRAVQLPQ